MAIQTLDALLAGCQPPRFISKGLSGTLVAGRPHSFWAMAGIPGPGSFDTTLNGIVRSSSSAMVNGQLPHVDPVSGNSYLARLVAQAAQGGHLFLCDRLWENGGITITSTGSQAIVSPTFPARDSAASTNGDGVYLGVEVSAATGSGTPTLTASYTNSAGTSGRTATNMDPTVASSIAGSFYRMGLAAGDLGVRSVQSLTLSATWTSGTINMVAYRVLASLPLAGVYFPNDLDATVGSLVRLANGAVPFLLFIPSTTTTTGINGLFVETQG